MKITIGLGCHNQHELTIEVLNLIAEKTYQIDELILIDDGSLVPFEENISKLNDKIKDSIVIIRNQKNIGVRRVMNQIYDNSTGDIIVFTHNDVLFFEQNWDVKIRETFNKKLNAGIVGAYGAKGIGTHDIYKTPYKLQQLARNTCVSNSLMDKEVHGFRNLKSEYENVAVFDGYFMAIKRELLDKTKGFSDILPEHHNYDNLICIQSLELGYENILISLALNHLGGRTDVGESWNETFGKTKQQIHEEAHPPLWEYGKGKLPIYIEDIYSENDGTICGYILYMNNKVIKEVIYE